MTRPFQAEQEAVPYAAKLKGSGFFVFEMWLAEQPKSNIP